jgi:glutathione synthase/RimK-type ligase-like ATP-grasp enzyme
MPAELSATEGHHAFLEAKYGLGGVLASLPALWVNHPNRAADATYKPMQLVVAARCGLSVPETLITNEAPAVRDFAQRGRTVTKLLDSSTIAEEGRRKLAYTNLVDEDALADLRGLEVTPHQFQRWVPKAYEARLIVIDKITAAAIHAGNASSYVDWRSRSTHGAHNRP